MRKITNIHSNIIINKNIANNTVNNYWHKMYKKKNVTSESMYKLDSKVVIINCMSKQYYEN